jgi:thiamine-monophosphate kinase
MNEIDLIESIFKPLAAATPGSLGLTDDAAIIEPPPGCELIVTADAVVGGVHFFPEDGAADIAWKSLAVNASDLAAKGAQPLAYTLCIALPGEPSREWLDAFASGLREAQQQFGIGLIGGDTVASPQALMIAITAWGAVPAGRMVRRNGAEPGDAAYVSGTVGDAALGLALRRDPALAQRWQLGGGELQHLLARYLRPQPRQALAAALQEYATAALDISDGLMLDFSRLCRASGIGGIIEAGAVPLSPAARRAIRHDSAYLETAITGGDDYEILATVSAGNESAFTSAAAAAGVAVTRLGVMREAPGSDLTGADGLPVKLSRHGYEHFL